MHVVRFWRAFRDFKHGKDRLLRQEEGDSSGIWRLIRAMNELDFLASFGSGRWRRRSASRRLARHRALANDRVSMWGDTRGSEKFFYTEIAHYLYPGDTRSPWPPRGFGDTSRSCWIDHGADCRAPPAAAPSPLLRGGRQALGSCGSGGTIVLLISAGADANALDRSGVAAFAPSVRTRSLPPSGRARRRRRTPTAEQVGLDALASRAPNDRRGGSGSTQSREQQAASSAAAGTWRSNAGSRRTRQRRPRQVAPRVDSSADRRSRMIRTAMIDYAKLSLADVRPDSRVSRATLRHLWPPRRAAAQLAALATR